MTKWEYCTVSGGMGQVIVADRTGARVLPRKVEVLAVVGELADEGWEAFAWTVGEDQQGFALRRAK
jgi:hypothetical protein